MKWTEEVDRRIEWINKRTPLTDLQVGYIEFQMFELLKLHEKVVKNNVGLAGVVKSLPSDSEIESIIDYELDNSKESEFNKLGQEAKFAARAAMKAGAKWFKNEYC